MRFRNGKSAASKVGKLVRRLLLKCATVMLVLSMAIIYPACGGDFLGLEDYQRDLLFGLGSLAIGLLSPAGTAGTVGPAGPAGEPGPVGPPGARKRRDRDGPRARPGSRPSGRTESAPCPSAGRLRS